MTRRAVAVRRIDHILIAMPAGREAEARAFYQGMLGLTELPKPAELAGRGGCWFTSGGVTVHLGVDKNFVAAGKAHPAFIVDGLAGMVAGSSRPATASPKTNRCPAASAGTCTILSATASS